MRASICAVLLIVLGVSSVGQAADRWWDLDDAAGLQTTNFVSSIDWQPGLIRWNTSATPGVNGRVGWVNGDQAIFQADGITYPNASGGVSVNGIIVNGTGYWISGSIALDSPEVTTNVAATFQTVFSGGVGLTKLGTDSLSLHGNATQAYTGTTLVSAGTLELSNHIVSNNPISASSLISVSSGAVLNVVDIQASGGFKLAAGQTLSGSGAVVGAVTADTANSKIAPRNNVGPQTFTGAGNITWTTDATYEVQIGGSGGGTGTAGTDFDQVLVTGSGKTITLGSAQLKILPMPGIVTGQVYRILTTTAGSSVAASGIFKNLAQDLNAGGPYTQGNVTYTIDYGYGAGGYVDVTFSAVPEPSSLTMLGIAACGLLRRRRV